MISDGAKPAMRYVLKTVRDIATEFDTVVYGSKIYLPAYTDGEGCNDQFLATF